MSFLDKSLVPAPEGYVVDLDNPDRWGDIAAYCCFGVGVFFSLLFTAQRIYVKTVLNQPWKTDDALLAVSWVTSMTTQCLIIRQFAIGVLGVHVWEVSMAHFNAAYFTIYITPAIYVIAGSCTKIALLVFYLRISPQQWLRYTVFIAISVIIGYSTGIFFALIFACTPVRKSFDITVHRGSCISNGPQYIATAVCNIASDFVLLVIPMVMVYGLQMPLKQKLGTFLLLGIGSITVVTSIIRAAILPTLIETEDVTWDGASASLLIIIESNLIICCGMLPTLNKFFHHVAPKVVGGIKYAKRTERTSNRPLPHLVTFGSLPISSRGYAKFSKDSSNVDGYSLTMIDPQDHEGRSEHLGLQSTSASTATNQAPVVTTRIEVSYSSRSEEALTGKGTT